jgi:DNA-binding CsgD family transcriptional regulator
MEISEQINLIRLLKNNPLHKLDAFCQSLASLCSEKQEIEITLYIRNPSTSYERVASSNEYTKQEPTKIPETALITSALREQYSNNGYAKVDVLITDKKRDLEPKTFAYPVTKDLAQNNLFFIATYVHPEVQLPDSHKVICLATELLDLKIEQNTTTPVQQEVGNLTLRQSKVLELVLRGKTNKEVAWQLDVSVPTVKLDLKNIFGIFGVSDRSGLSRQFNRHRINECGPISQNLVASLNFGRN